MKVDASQLYQVGATLETNTGRLGARGSAVLRKVAYDTVAGVQQQIRAMDAIDTGAMLNSVDPPEFRGDGRHAVMEAEVGPTVDYAIYVHEGTDRMAPRPFMDAPVSRAEQQLPAAFAKITEDLL